MSLIETNLKASLSLVGIYRGQMAWLPPENVSELANGIWLNLAKAIDISEVQLPKALLFTYKLRMIFVRRIDTTNNVLDTKIADGSRIIEFIYDNFRMSSLSLTDGQVLWWLPRTAEFEPDEDAFVGSISADLTASAFESEIQVRTKIS